MAKPARGCPASPWRSDRSSSRSFSPSRSRSCSYSGSCSPSSSRSCSRSRSKSFSSSSHPSRSGNSRSPSPAARKSPAEGVKRGRSPPPETKKASPPPRKASPIPESLVLHVDQLSRNVNENHLKEIFSFGFFGEVVNVRVAMDHVISKSTIGSSTLIAIKTRLTSPKDLHMSSSGVGQMRKRPKSKADAENP